MSDVDLNRLIPERAENKFQSDSMLDEVTKCRATCLDFTRTVGGRSGSAAFDAAHPLGPSTWEDVIIPNLKKLTCDVVASLEDYMVLPTRDQQFAAFQYFGGDIIIDDTGKVWLCELNTRPWCGFDRWWEDFDPEYRTCPSIWRFMESLLRLCVDPYFPSGSVPQDSGAVGSMAGSDESFSSSAEWNVESAWCLVDERKLS